MRSFKSKIILLLALVFSTTAAAVMYFTHRDVKLAMVEHEEGAAQNVLELVELNIRAGYNQLISDKIEILARMGEQLKQSTQISANVFSTYRQLAEDGVLSEDAAQKKALEWLHNFPFDEGSLFVMLNDGTVIPSAQERLSMVGIRDLKGRPIVDAMRSDSLSPEGDRAVFVWSINGGAGHKHMGFFVPISHWGWTVFGVVNFENIEAESRKELDKIIEGLRKTFERINIGDRGYAFLYDGDKKLLVPPPETEDKELDGRHEQRLTDLIQGVVDGVSHVQYTDPFMQEELVETFTSYFKAFDWYLTVVVPVSEIQEPAQALVKRQIVIIALVFFVSLVAVFSLDCTYREPIECAGELRKAASQ